MRALATRFGYMVTQGGQPPRIGRYLPDFGHSPLHPRRYPRATGCLACLTLQIRSGKDSLDRKQTYGSRLLHLDVSWPELRHFPQSLADLKDTLHTVTVFVIVTVSYE
jgi:hypothetical protein